MSIKELKENIQNRKITSVQTIEEYIKNIEMYEDKIGAFIYFNKEQVLEDAKKIDERIAKGEKVGELAGVPVLLKDNICTKYAPTTCASKMLINFISPIDATIVEKMREEGAVFIGKANLDEFAMGSSTTTSYFKKTRNPYDLTRIPGGSSGGSAAAVSAGMVPISIGTDTGGSMRQPASHCGIYAIKPSYGTVSRNGIVAYASSFDQAGPMGRSVEDLAYMLDIISFYDERETTSLKKDREKTYPHLENDIKGMKIAVPVSFFEKEASDDVKKVIAHASENFQKMGAIVEEVDIENLEYSLPTYYVLSSAEASSNLAKFDSIEFGYRTENFETLEDLYRNTRAEGFGDEVKKKILFGAYVLSAGHYDEYYTKALKVRNLIKKSFERIFQDYDAILAPTSPSVARKIEEKNTKMDSYLEDIYTVPVNIAGLTALSMPAGYSTKEGLPIGMQLIGKNLGESTILNLGHIYEKTYKDEISRKPVIK